MIKNLILVGAGGFLGSALRYLISNILSNLNLQMPWPTFAVNIIGSFLIGMLMASYFKNAETTNLILITGFCGGFTTFSTFSYENLQLLQDGNYRTAIMYILLSILIGLLTVMLGFSLSQKIS